MVMLADIKEEEQKPTGFELPPANPILSCEDRFAKRRRELEFAKIALKTRRDEVREAARKFGHRLGAWSGTVLATCKRCGAQTDRSTFTLNCPQK